MEEGSTGWSPKCDFEELGAPTAGWHVESTTALAGRASGASGGGHGHEQTEAGRRGSAPLLPRSSEFVASSLWTWVAAPTPATGSAFQPQGGQEGSLNQRPHLLSAQVWNLVAWLSYLQGSWKMSWGPQQRRGSDARERQASSPGFLWDTWVRCPLGEASRQARASWDRG